MTKHARATRIVFSALCLCLLALPVQAAEVESIAVTPASGGDSPARAEHNVTVEHCFMTNYSPFGGLFAQPSTYFTDDASWSNLVYSVHVADTQVAERQIYFVAMFYNMGTGELTTANIGVNGDALDPEHIYTYTIPFWDLQAYLTRGARYAVNVYLHPMQQADVTPLNSNTWHIITFY